ncbi:MAG: alpha/beta fold hydrolase [Kiritimatiellae bacterium]|nr:alpha/beta fold hydrolase [Kiritimatiellia bacterium]
MKHGPVILVGGWGYPPQALAPLAEMLGRTVTLLAPDAGPAAPAAGAAARHGPVSPFAAALRARLSGCSEPPVVIGWSMGGLVALETAAAEPAVFGRLVLVNATARFCSDVGYPCGVAPGNLRAMRAGLARDPDAILSRFFADAAAPACAGPASVEAAVSAAKGQGTERLVAGLQYLARADLRGGLAAVRVPTLVVHGEADRIIPAAAAEYLGRHLPAARLRLLPGMGHELPLRAPDWLGAQIAAFLETNR